MLYLCKHTVYQCPCHSRGQLRAGRQRDTVGGGTAAGNWLHLDQNHFLGEGSQGRHSLYQLSWEREREILILINLKIWIILACFLDNYRRFKLSTSSRFFNITTWIVKDEVPLRNIFTLPRWSYLTYYDTKGKDVHPLIIAFSWQSKDGDL